EIVNSLINIGHVKYSQTKLDDAVDYYSRAIVLLKEFDSTNHLQIATIFYWIGIIRNRQRSFDRAIECLEQCLKIREASLSPGESDITLILSYLSKCYEHINQFKTALEYYKQALYIYVQYSSNSFEQETMEDNIDRLSTILNNLETE
ncbi:unnamed protein product, partial [Adineta steineri]